MKARGASALVGLGALVVAAGQVVRVRLGERERNVAAEEALELAALVALRGWYQGPSQ